MNDTEQVFFLFIHNQFQGMANGKNPKISQFSVKGKTITQNFSHKF